MVQGSVLVARRRGFQFATLLSHLGFEIATYDLAQKCPDALKLVLIPDPLMVYTSGRRSAQWTRAQV